MNYIETNFDDKKAIEIRTANAKMIVITECGPRIAFWGASDGDNLLFWDTKNMGRNDWKLMGGHRVWPTRPDADESEDAYRPDNDFCTVDASKDSITITSGLDPILKIRKGYTVKILADDRFSIDNFIKNEGDMLYSAGVWALTCTTPAPGRTYSIPLGNDTSWDCFRIVYPKAWAGHTSPVDDKQIIMSDDTLYIKPMGIETKRMLEAPKGIIAMSAPDQNITFVKKIEYLQDAKYPMGTNIAFYIGLGNFMVEMETMGPERTILPGTENRSEEIWVLTKADIDIKDPKALTALFS